MAFVRELKTRTGVYLVKVESFREKGRIKQRHLGVVGKIVNGKRVFYGSVQNSKITDVSIAGNVIVLKQIASELNLEDLLDVHTEENGKFVMALVLAHCTSPSSINSMTRWCRKYGAEDLLNLQQEECKKDNFYRALDHLDSKAIAKIEKKLFENMRELLKENKAFFYDITRAYFCGTKCTIAKSGYSPEGLGKPQINIGLAVTKDYGFPIFHQVYDGNIQDARSIKQAIESLKDFGIRKASVVWDRGITSEKAISVAKNAGLEVVAGLPLKGQLKYRAIEMRKGINTIHNRIRLSTQILYAKSSVSNVYGHKGKLVICSNEKVKELLKELRYDEIENAVQRIENGLDVKDKIKKFLDGNKPNTSAINQEELSDGLYALFCTDMSLNTRDIVKTYFDKDIVEKAFKCLKGMINVRPVRHWLADRVKAHVFVCYLSYALLSVLSYKLKIAGIDKTPSSALGLLENLHRVTINDPTTGNSFVKHSVMSKEQENIFKAVDKNLIKSVV